MTNLNETFIKLEKIFAEEKCKVIKTDGEFVGDEVVVEFSTWRNPTAIVPSYQKSFSKANFEKEFLHFIGR